MKALLLAAGLGTRLRPLTDHRPKALVEVGGLPLLEIAVRRLKYFGFRELVVNIHHFGEQVIDFLAWHQNFGLNIALSDERDLLLDTGGAIRKARLLLGETDPFLVYNVDVVTSLDLPAMIEWHRQSGGLATLAVRRRPTSRYFLFDPTGRLQGWRNKRSGEERWCAPAGNPGEVLEWAFSGIHVLDPAIFDLLPEQAVFSIVDAYLMLGREHRILAYPHDHDDWVDCGKPDSLAAAAALLPNLKLANRL